MKNKTTNEYERIGRWSNQMNVECNVCVCIFVHLVEIVIAYCRVGSTPFYSPMSVFLFLSFLLLKRQKKRMHGRRTTVFRHTREMVLVRKKKTFFKYYSIECCFVHFCGFSVEDNGCFIFQVTKRLCYIYIPFFSI